MAIRFHLNPLDEFEVGEYVMHRLQVSGREEPLFTDLAIKRIYEYSRGVPREINNLCNLALLVGFSKSRNN